MFLDLHVFSISINSIYILMIPKSEQSNFQKQNDGYAWFSSHATYLHVQARKRWSHWTVISYHMTVDDDVTQKTRVSKKKMSSSSMCFHANVFRKPWYLSIIVFK